MLHFFLSHSKRWHTIQNWKLNGHNVRKLVSIQCVRKHGLEPNSSYFAECLMMGTHREKKKKSIQTKSFMSYYNIFFTRMVSFVPLHRITTCLSVWSQHKHRIHTRGKNVISIIIIAYSLRDEVFVCVQMRICSIVRGRVPLREGSLVHLFSFCHRHITYWAQFELLMYSMLLIHCVCVCVVFASKSGEHAWNVWIKMRVYHTERVWIICSHLSLPPRWIALHSKHHFLSIFSDLFLSHIGM